MSASEEVRARSEAWLSRHSALFEEGGLDGKLDDRSFVRRVNTCIEIKNPKGTTRRQYPKTRSLAIRADGSIHIAGELLVFGAWLFEQDRPGLGNRSGRQPNRRILLQTVAVALAAWRQAMSGQAVPEGSRRSCWSLKAKGLAHTWNDVFGVLPKVSEPSDFPARKRSMIRHLEDYLAHLRSGAFTVDGKTARRSAELEAVLKAQTGSQRRRSDLAGTGVGPVVVSPPVASPMPPARPVPDSASFELVYSSAATEEAYRGHPAGTLPRSRLHYEIGPPASTSTSGGPSRTRIARRAISPEVSLKDYRFDAILDRLVMLVTTRRMTEPSSIQNTLKPSSATAWIVDRTAFKPRASDGWSYGLPLLDLTHPTGHHFAVVLQEPTPRLVQAVLEHIDAAYELVGDVGLQLVELAIDVYPRREDPDECLILREKMVGLMQRHHVVRSDILNVQGAPLPSQADARQVYSTGSTSNQPERTDRLFRANRSTRHLSDGELRDASVRDRILRSTATSDLFLDSTIYQGAKSGPVLTRVQHKITDRRNPDKGTKIDLPEKRRRARVEAQLTGPEALAGAGMSSIEDLARRPFHKIRKQALLFKLATAEDSADAVDEAMSQLRSRGVYGVCLHARALQTEDDLAHKGRNRPPRLPGEFVGVTNWDEMSVAVQGAVKPLNDRWQRFAWVRQTPR